MTDYPPSMTRWMKPCRYCGVEIIWAILIDFRHGKLPRPHPFDVEPVVNGRYCLFYPKGDTQHLHAKYIASTSVNDWPTGSVPRVSHFTSCEFILNARKGSRRPRK